jgi:glycosyltransferase involved in cell wall biosynthesis
MNSTPSQVSVVMIFLDAEEFIQEAIDSVLAQTYPWVELILVDDGSTDTSTTIARQCASLNVDRVRYVDHPGHTNHGMSAARALGIEVSSGDLVAFLDADDKWSPDHLELQVAMLVGEPTPCVRHRSVGRVGGTAGAPMFRIPFRFRTAPWWSLPICSPRSSKVGRTRCRCAACWPDAT